MRALEIAELHVALLRISTADFIPHFLRSFTYCDIPFALLTYLASLALAMALIVFSPLASGPSSSVSIENAPLAGFVIFWPSSGVYFVDF